jgi:hypothetical protein
VIKLNAKDIKIGDILDAYIEGESMHRVMITEIGKELIFGIDSDNLEWGIDPKYEVEKVIVNINNL